MKTRASVLSIVALAVSLVAAGPLWAGAEKGSRKCSDGVDNDGDGLIDGDDPDCGDGGGGGGEETGNFRVVIDWDGAITDHVFNDATIQCATSGEYCEILSDDSFTLRIPETYWSQWTLGEAQECFGASLGFGMDAEVSGLSIDLRDHHGSVDHWRVSVDYSASFIGTTAFGTHHANFQGDCAGPCPDLPPPAGTTNIYDMGYLTRTQRASRTRRLGGDACTCAWEDCLFAPNAVTVTVEGLP